MTPITSIVSPPAGERRRRLVGAGQSGAGGGLSRITVTAAWVLALAPSHWARIAACAGARRRLRLALGASDAKPKSRALPYRANFLLPHRHSAWIRFAERLEELARFGADIQPAQGRNVLPEVSAHLEKIASELMSHVEPV